MKTFIEYVVEDLIKSGIDFSRTMIVFPNKRASLFFNNELVKRAPLPMWSPVYTTISELFRQHTVLQVADNIKLICDLYKCFRNVMGSDETFDHFFGWGQMMIADFDDIDKSMADARKIFTHAGNLKELDDASYLTDTQEKAIRMLFANFSKDMPTRLQERFLRLWRNLFEIYETFNSCIREQGLAYEGGLYRSVVEDKTLKFDYDNYVFVGFNVIQKVEQKLFDRLKTEGKARFYWDFDYYYLTANGVEKNEAGHFIRKYMEHYPNALDCRDENIFNNFSREKNIELISATTENIQARYITKWLKKVNNEGCLGVKPDTAVVLCNEDLLSVAVHCIPNEVKHVNITTGYQLHSSPHVAEIYDKLKSAKTPKEYIERGKRYVENATENNSAKSNILSGECLFRLYSILQRLESLLDEMVELDVKVETIDRLFRQIVRTSSVPFHGEPAIGLQMMGVLETRNLDFRNILILSCNEGNMPKGVNETSFIPHILREAYGLTTINHKVAVYAYYFHRMLQRAENITILYNSSVSDSGKNEMSRFMLQMMVESNHKISFQSLRGGVDDRAATTVNSNDISGEAASDKVLIDKSFAIEKSPVIIDKMLRKFALKTDEDEEKALLTPTAINKYLRCQLQFYYNYVLGIKEEKDEEDAFDKRIFGNIFHDAAQELYKPFVERRRIITKSDIQSLLGHREIIERAVVMAFEKHVPSEQKRNSGLALIIHDVIMMYLNSLLKHDLHLAPFTIVGLECQVVKEITLDTVRPDDVRLSNVVHPVKTAIGGRIDRLDRVVTDGMERLRVVDYKTGRNRAKKMPTIDDIFNGTKIHEHSDYYLQTFVYGQILCDDREQNPAALPVSPALFYIQHAASADYDPTLVVANEKVNDVGKYAEDFSKGLAMVIRKMFSRDEPFKPTKDKRICESCEYAVLCKCNLSK